MNPKTTIILALLAVAGGVAILLSPAKKADETENKPEQPAKAAALLDPKPDKDSIVRVAFERSGKPRLAFERSGAKDDSGQFEPWRMTEPAAGATDSPVVDGLVHTLIELTSKRSFKAGGDGGVSVKDAGLDAPTATLMIADKTGKETKLEIGRRVPMSNNYYVRIAGSDTIHETDRDFSYDMKRDVGDYRGKSPLRVARNNAVQVHIDYDGAAYEIARNGEDWVLSSPAKAYASAEKVKSIVNALANVRIDKFVDDAPTSLAAFGLDRPYLRVAVRTEEKKLKPASQPAGSTQPVEPQFETTAKTHEILIGGVSDATNGFRFMKLPDQPWVATIPSSAVEQLLPKDIREMRLTRASAAAITQLAISTGDSSANLTKKNGVWTGEGDLAEIDGDAVQTLCDTIAGLKAVDFVDDPSKLEKAGLDKPRATITATITGQVEPLVVRIGNETEIGDQAGAAFVPAGLAAKLIVPPISLRSRNIFSAPVSQISRIEQHRGEIVTIVERAGDQWKLVQPDGAAADASGMGDITRDLSSLRAKRVVSKGGFETRGFDKPSATVTFTIDANASSQPAESQPAASAPAAPQTPATHTITLSRFGVGFFARLDENPYLFELDETVYRSLTGELIRRKLFDFDAKAVQRMRIESNNGMVEFVLGDDNKWTYTPDPSVKPSQSKIVGLAGLVSNMAVEQYLMYRGADVAAAEKGAQISIEVALKNGETATIKVQPLQRGEAPRMASWMEKGCTFVLRSSDAEALIRGLDYYIQEEAPQPPPEDQGPPPGLPPGFPGGG
ncbi:MAG: DUF4340 domain-containing protein [Planctomycetes bacterium]|nr:DUF4340 domain-containing protein [Planctomycetota bacterium]